MKKRYYELDALRGMAALFVMFFHYTKETAHDAFFHLGATAVDLFFMISGFVIFLSINNISSGREFVISRVSRLYPTYWTCVSFTFSVMVFSRILHLPINHFKDIDFVDYLGNMTMFQYYFNIPNLDGPYWTMLIEMLFYIFILLLFELKLLSRVTEICCCILVFIITNFFLVKKGLNPDCVEYFPLLNHFALFFAGITFYKIANNLQNKVKGYLIIVFCMLSQIAIFNFSRLDLENVTFSEYILMLLVYFLIFTLFQWFGNILSSHRTDI